MSNRQEIYITGAGIVSAIGIGWSSVMSSFLDGRGGIGSIKYLDTDLTAFPVGEVPASNAELASALLVRKDLPRTSLLGIAALRDALDQAEIDHEAPLAKIPLISGTTVGGMDLSEKSWPKYSASHDCGSATDAIADAFGGTIFSTTLSTACSSAANAIIFGANLIRCGLAEMVIAGGSESLSDFHLHGFNSLMILDKTPCRPFDASRAGLNLGEGAAFLVLESASSVARRGISPKAILSGFGNSCDAFHQTATSPDGEGPYLAMCKALKDAGMAPTDIDYINAHGTGTVNNDLSESVAIRRVFGENHPPVSSTKGLTGHATSAAGGIEAVFSIMSLVSGFIPGRPDDFNPDLECILPCRAQFAKPRKVMSNSFGFGGNDSSLIFAAI